MKKKKKMQEKENGKWQKEDKEEENEENEEEEEENEEEEEMKKSQRINGIKNFNSKLVIEKKWVNDEYDYSHIMKYIESMFDIDDIINDEYIIQKGAQFINKIIFNKYNQEEDDDDDDDDNKCFNFNSKCNQKGFIKFTQNLVDAKDWFKKKYERKYIIF